ncbi:hypothetical protein [Paludisphaera soli]|uniref:hypothetical protein n=1 Tax=Paludisphaera soli TaxID=2712865 RepID=UPI0013ED98B2|nr:hypothetical protein [Paludisphaera soli]
MFSTDVGRPILVYKFASHGGGRYVVYNSAMLGNPPDHLPNKWYARTYPVSMPLGEAVGEAFETAEEAVRAARAVHARIDGTPSLA